MRGQLPGAVGALTHRFDVFATLGRAWVGPMTRRLSATRRLEEWAGSERFIRPGTKRYMINQATGAATSSESSRSITPPCPAGSEPCP